MSGPEASAHSSGLQFRRTQDAPRQDVLEISVLGNVAVVTGWLVTFGHGAKGDFYRRYRFTDTWVRGTNWRIIAAHDVLVTLKR